MAVLQTGQSFASGDQVTATKLEDIANLATFVTGTNNTADNSTIQVDAVGGYLKVPSNGIGSNELSSNATVDANRAVGTNHIKDGAVTADKLDSAAVSVLMPTATVLPYAGSTLPGNPDDWLFCAGQSVSTSTYADLHGVIGYTYGGSGASFNLPDLRGRVIAGLDNMGGTAAGRLTGQTTLGGFTGTQSVTLQLSQIPSHTHGYGYNTVQDSTSGGDTRLATSSNNTLKTTSSAGGGGSHTNVQPTMTLNYIIKT